MKIYKITQLSDSCISSGDISGTAVDRDACYDNFGFPYIPAKRIKGCLREIAEQILDWYIDDREKDMIVTLFGVGDNGESERKSSNKDNLRLVITDACVEKIEEKHKQILWARKKGYSEYVNVRNIIDNYTYVRYQTAIDGEIAKRNSLRTTRVVKKGTEFFFQSNIDEFDTKYIKFFNQCCMALWHMGSSRSRGLGKIKIEEYKKEKGEILSNIEEYTIEKAVELQKEYLLEFDIKLETPMIFPTHSIGCTASETYIPGSSIMGYFANQYKIENKMAEEDKFEELFLSGNIIFQNAYITYNKESTMPVPLSLYKEKGKSISDELCYDMVKRSTLAENINVGERPKLEWVGNDYCKLHFSKDNIVKDIDVISVERTLNYHYKGNINKSNIKENEMFQMIGIEKKQSFRARILGKGIDIKEILPLVKHNGCITLGTSKTAQYGRGKIELIKNTPQEIPSSNQVIHCKKIVVILNSPLILFDEDILSYSADIDLLRKELENKLGISRKDRSVSLKCIQSKMQYKVIGGYNTKWRLAKEKITAIDAGSVFVFESVSEDIPIPVPESKYKNIGERINEGYGEFTVYSYESFVERPLLKKVYNLDREKIPESVDLEKFTELRNILKRRVGKEVKDIARRNAKNIFGTDAKINQEFVMSSAAVNKALLQLQNNIRLDEFLKRQKSIKDIQKLSQSIVCIWMLEEKIKKEKVEELITSEGIAQIRETAISFLEKVRNDVAEKYEKEICHMIKEEEFLSWDTIFIDYTQEFLVQAKLLLRGIDKSESVEGVMK